VESKFFHQKEASKKPNSAAKVYRRGEYRTFTTAGVYLLYLFSPHIQLDSYWLGVLFKTRACDDSHQKNKTKMQQESAAMIGLSIFQDQRTFIITLHHYNEGRTYMAKNDELIDTQLTKEIN